MVVHNLCRDRGRVDNIADVLSVVAGYGLVYVCATDQLSGYGVNYGVYGKRCGQCVGGLDAFVRGEADIQVLTFVCSATCLDILVLITWEA